MISESRFETSKEIYSAVFSELDVLSLVVDVLVTNIMVIWETSY